ncbi:MAG: hypothetical protein CMJ48_02770 [Planctomycetaceae bacterium]|nr:hypothetical protein [Planctomycetaceae bacterium]
MQGNSIEHSLATLFQGKADLTAIAESPSFKNARAQIEVDGANWTVPSTNGTRCAAASRRTKTNRPAWARISVPFATARLIQYNSARVSAYRVPGVDVGFAGKTADTVANGAEDTRLHSWEKLDAQ